MQALPLARANAGHLRTCRVNFYEQKWVSSGER
jgi:hypothetical protein